MKAAQAIARRLSFNEGPSSFRGDHLGSARSVQAQEQQDGVSVRKEMRFADEFDGGPSDGSGGGAGGPPRRKPKKNGGDENGERRKKATSAGTGSERRRKSKKERGAASDETMALRSYMELNEVAAELAQEAEALERQAENIAYDSLIRKLGHALQERIGGGGKERVKKLLHEIDSNGDGVIQKIELRKMVRRPTGRIHLPLTLGFVAQHRQRRACVRAGAQQAQDQGRQRRD